LGELVTFFKYLINRISNIKTLKGIFREDGGTLHKDAEATWQEATDKLPQEILSGYKEKILHCEKS